MTRALLVVDAQRMYEDSASELHCRDVKATLLRINALIAEFVAAGAATVFIRHVHRADGSDLGRMFDFAGESVEWRGFKAGSPGIAYASGLHLPVDRVELTKNRYSAFEGTNLHQLLRGREVDRLAVCGFMTNFCCESTARAAHDKDYFVDFILDATGTPGLPDMDEARIRHVVAGSLAAGFARVIATSEYVARMSGHMAD